MQNPRLCHQCNEREIAVELRLPKGQPVCRECFDKHVESENARKAARKKSTGFVPKITKHSGPGGIAIIGFNPPKE